MFNLDNTTKKDNNKDWPYRKLIIGPSGSGKTNYLLNAKHIEGPKYKLLIDKREKSGTNFNNDTGAFI